MWLKVKLKSESKEPKTVILAIADQLVEAFLKCGYTGDQAIAYTIFRAPLKFIGFWVAATKTRRRQT